MGSIRLSKKYGLNPTMLVCALCGQPTNEIALLGANKGGKADMYTNIGTLCDSCTTQRETHCAFIVVDNEANKSRTGEILWVAQHAIEHILNDDSDVQAVLTSGAMYVNQEAADHIKGMFNQTSEETSGACHE